MKYFLLPDGGKYKIMKMQPEDLEIFRSKHRRRIILKAESIEELLLLLPAWIEDVQFNP